MENAATFGTSTNNGQASAIQNESSNTQNELQGAVGLESNSGSKYNLEPDHGSTAGSDSTSAIPEDGASQKREMKKIKLEEVETDDDDDDYDDEEEEELSDDFFDPIYPSPRKKLRKDEITDDIQEAPSAQKQKQKPADDLFPSEPQLKDVVPISSKEFENALEDALVCPVCYLPYNSKKRRPRMLACGHTFCSFCISQIHKKDLFTFSFFHHISVTCPVCRAKHTFDSQKDIPLNRVVEDLIHVGNPPENNDNKEKEGDFGGHSSNNTVNMTRKGMILLSLFMILLSFGIRLWNANASLQKNLDMVNNKLSTDLDIIHTKLSECMYMTNGEDQLGCLNEAFGKTTNNMDDKLNIKEKEEEEITDKKIYPQKSHLMDILLKKDQFPNTFSSEKDYIFSREEDFFYKLSKSFNADNINAENFFELMMSLDFTSPGQSGLWLWLEKGLTWMLQYFFMAHCIRYYCLYWWLRCGALAITGYITWKTGKGIQAAFPVVSGAGGSAVLMSAFTYMVYYVVSGNNWVSAWLYSEFSFFIVQTNSLGGSILYGVAFMLSMLVIVVIWCMDMGHRHQHQHHNNNNNGAAVNAQVGAIAAEAAAAEAAAAAAGPGPGPEVAAAGPEESAAAAAGPEAAAAAAAAAAIAHALEPAEQADVSIDLGAADPTRGKDAPIKLSAVAMPIGEKQSSTNIDSASVPQDSKTQSNPIKPFANKENGTPQNLTESGIAIDEIKYTEATNST